MTSAVTLIRKTSTLAACVLAVWLLAGCDKKERQASENGADTSASASETPAEASNSAADGPKIIYAEGPKPGPDTVLAEAGEVEVTLADFERSMKRSMLIAPEGMTEVPKERLATPHLQINVVRNLLSTKIIAKEAERRGLTASLDEKVAALESSRQIAELAPLLRKEKAEEAKLEKIGLTRDDLHTIARNIVLRQKLRAALADDISDEQLWKAYEQQHNQIRLLLVGARNTPSMGEISTHVEEHPERIKEHFDKNKKRYRSPMMVRLTMLSPAPGQKVDPATLQEAAEHLDRGDAPAKIASELGLESESGALLVRGENTRAFDAEAGSTGFQTKGPRGAYAWKVEGHRDSKEAELTAALKREIAAELLRQNTIVASRQAKLADAIEQMGTLPTTGTGKGSEVAAKKLAPKLEAKGLEVHVTPMFSHNERGFIPGVGLAEEISEKAFAMDLHDPIVDKPILSRGKAWAFRVLDRQKASREQFEKEKEAFRKQYVERLKDRLVMQFTNHYEDQHNARLDLEPLRVKYGTLQK